MLAWGHNTYGQLGDGTKEDRLAPVEVSGLTDVISVHTGGFNSFALRADGTVWAWGLNSSGQLGIGTTTEQLTPAQVPGLSNAVQMDSGGFHTLVLADDGTVWGWGNNSSGQLDDGTITLRTSPVQSQNLADIVRVVAGSNHTSLALEADGTLLMWGRHLGFGPGTDSRIPTAVPGVPGIVDFSAGGYGVSNVDLQFVLALDEDGEIWEWDNESYFRQEDASYVFIPTRIPSFGSPVAMAISTHGAYFALLDDGTTWAWGFGYLGNGEGHSSFTTPTQIASLTNIRSVHPGLTHTLAVDDNGELWAWGLNTYGQLGDGTTEARYEPVAVTVLEGAP